MSNVRAIEFAQFGVTNVHPLTIVLMLIMGGFVVSKKRSGAVFAVLSICIFIPMEQRIVVGGLDFSMLRLIVVLGWIRVLVKQEYRGVRFGNLDRLVLLWTISAAFFYLLRVGPSAIAYRLGLAMDVLGSYFLLRLLVRTREDVLGFWRSLAWIAIVVSPFLVYESVYLHNAFGFFSYTGFSPVEIRDGTPRAYGPFSHPVLAGTFGSVVIPAFIGVLLGWKQQRKLFVLACFAAFGITIASGSSGPLVALAVGAAGWAMWRFRAHTRAVIWATIFLAVVVHLIRDKPVWHLILRLQDLTGGTGDHRYRLIDAFVNRFSEWALVGTDNMAYWGWGLQDVTNQYISEGVNGGVVTFVLFILLLRAGFAQLRSARIYLERAGGARSPWALLAWGISASLAAHCASFVSVTYFGRLFPFFLLFVATLPAVGVYKRRRQPRSKRAAPSRASAQSQSPLPVTSL